ncbi:uncharacterized protein LOC105699086 isoform X2 [Orussus abietinus]|nr:uncharacterized protein LOC105699086 isoform X2 [Orussus abietinus]
MATLFCGSTEHTRSLIFETAIHWADEGRRVVYVAPKPLASLPPIYHDRNPPAAATFKLIRFMYLPNYEALMEQLVDLHKFEILPTVLIIDNLEHYASDPSVKGHREIHIARMCTLILDSMNAVSKITNIDVHACASIDIEKDLPRSVYALYFDNIWEFTRDQDKEGTFWLKKMQVGLSNACSMLYKYAKRQDGSVIFEKAMQETVKVYVSLKEEHTTQETDSSTS